MNCIRGPEFVDPRLSLSQLGLSSSQQVCLLVALIVSSSDKAQRLAEHAQIGSSPLVWNRPPEKHSECIYWDS